ncbi:MAG: mycothiol system anti-sigma-R factor [Demequinaceae bacterium]|nr:mycothiol system anti-sigma-R factor [Demequinaceae bacterium]
MVDHCDELMDRLFAYIDKELPEDELRAIAEHLEGCGPCEAQRRAFERIKQMVAGCPHEVAPDRLRERVLGIITDAKGIG